MTTPDLGSERPGDPSDTRQMAELDHHDPEPRVSGRFFWIALAVIALAIAAFAITR